MSSLKRIHKKFFSLAQYARLAIHTYTTPSLLNILGASGSGKSSVLRAGLLHQLKLGQVIPGSDRWIYLDPFTPKEEPLRSLQEAFKLTPQSPSLDKLPIVMVIDQVEEVFTMCDDAKRKEFFDYILKLLEQTDNLCIFIGMRSDFRGRLREYPEFTNKIDKPFINVEHLNREEIEEAIAQPADWVGLGIEGALKQQLVNDVEDYPGSLPLLQYTLTELWNEARKQGEKFLRLETYRKLGGIEGTLQKRANEVYDSLSEAEKTVAQRLFLELTQVGETIDIRRRVYLSELVNSHHSWELLQRVSDKLANEKARLITKTDTENEKGVVLC